MKSSSLQNKVVRPSYGQYYHSDRHAKSKAAVADNAKASGSKGQALTLLLLVVLVVGGLWVGFRLANAKTATPATHQTSVSAAGNAKKPAAAAASPVAVNPCADNALPQLALVSIGQRHMWACEGSKQVYDSPVVTGIEYLAADRTPTGTYHIYGKETDLTLTGSDSTGSWSDPVSYWMPFLDNQYGAYGFHDATWRADSAFGNIDPNSSDASHGCVELPLATAAWMYHWAVVGTTVTIES